MEPIVAIEELVEHQEHALAVARSLAGDEHEARDVVQDAWRSILGRPPRRADNLRGFVGTVVRRMAGRHFRRRRGRSWMSVSDAGGPQAVSPPDGDRFETAALLKSVAKGLPEPYRSTILLHFFQGLELGEIASIHGCPRTTIRTRKQRALRLMRERLRVTFRKTLETDWLGSK